MCSTRATHTKVNENTVMGAMNSMICVEVQGRWEGDLYGPLGEGRKAPLGRVYKEGGIPPHPPLFFDGGRTGRMGRHVTQSIRDGTGSDSGCLQLVFEQRWQTLCRWYRLVFLCVLTCLLPTMFLYPTIYPSCPRMCY